MLKQLKMYYSNKSFSKYFVFLSFGALTPLLLILSEAVLKSSVLSVFPKCDKQHRLLCHTPEVQACKNITCPYPASLPYVTAVSFPESK